VIFEKTMSWSLVGLIASAAGAGLILSACEATASRCTYYVDGSCLTETLEIKINPIRDILPGGLVPPNTTITPPTGAPPGTVWQYPDGRKTWRPNNNPGREYPIELRPPTQGLPQLIRGADCCATRDILNASFEYNASTARVSFTLDANVVGDRLADVPADHATVVQNTDGTITFTLDRDSLGTFCLRNGIASIQTEIAGVFLEFGSATLNRKQMGGVPYLKTEDPVNGTQYTMIVTKW